MYYSNEDFENFYVRYKAEALPQKISIQEFCIRNKVSWNLFNKWYRDTRHRIEEVTVTGRPEGHPAEGQAEAAGNPSPEGNAAGAVPASPDSTRIMVDIRMSNGLHVSQKGLSYQRLLALVGNLEGLC